MVFSFYKSWNNTVHVLYSTCKNSQTMGFDLGKVYENIGVYNFFCNPVVNIVSIFLMGTCFFKVHQFSAGSFRNCRKSSYIPKAFHTPSRSTGTVTNHWDGSGILNHIYYSFHNYRMGCYSSVSYTHLRAHETV